jgi:hypothetical protein
MSNYFAYTSRITLKTFRIEKETPAGMQQEKNDEIIWY